MTGGRSLLTAVLAAVTLAVTAAAARADDEIALSLDGATWRDELRAPLFDGARVWVPGDSETRSFFVRNEGPSDARLVISVVTEDDDRLLADGDVLLAVRVANGPWATVRNGDDVRGLVRGALRQGEDARVDVRATFRWASPEESMVETLPLRLVVALRQSGQVDEDPERPDGLLPDTGGTVARWLVLAAVACVGIGLVLVVAGRRRRRVDE